MCFNQFLALRWCGVVQIHSLYPLAAGGGAGDFRKFSVRGAGKFLGYIWAGPLGEGAPKSRGGLKILMNFVKM